MVAAATATAAATTINLSLTAFRTTIKSSITPNPPVAAGLFAGLSFRWFTTLLDTLQQLSPSPLLMFPPPPPPADHKKSGGGRNTFNRYYSPIDDKLVKLGWNSPEDTFDARCIGSCHMALAYISRRDCSVFLFNPFTQTSLNLPSIETLPCVTSKSQDWFCTTFFSVQKHGPKGFNTDYIDSVTLSEYFIEKLIITNPKVSAKDRTVWIIYGENRDIAFWRYGHDSWTLLNSPFSGYNEFVHWKDQVFFTLIESIDIVECWDLCCKSSASPLRIEINAVVSPSGDSSVGVLKKQCKYKRYLVNSNDEILMVVRYFYELKSESIYDDQDERDNGYGVYMTFSFDVYKLDLGQISWECVKNIGENAIFLGRNHSFSCSTLEFDGLKKNSIYFTNDVVYEYPDSRTSRLRKKFSDDAHDFGVFDIEDGSIKPCYSLSSFQKVDPPPVWIVLTEAAKHQ